MKNTKYLLVGGGLASYRAARRIRKLDSASPILLAGGEPHVPYNRPPLTKEWMQGKSDLSKVFLDTRENCAKLGIELELGVEVRQLDLANRRAHLANDQTIGFEKALIATGGRPRTLDIPGTDLEGVHYFRTLDDAQSVSAELAPGRRALIIGGGFIGVELASSFAQRGLAVTLVHTGPYIWSNFADEPLGRFFQDCCTQHGVAFLTSDQVTGLTGNGRVSAGHTKSGKTIACDLVVMAVGIAPNIELAQQAGLEVGDGIIVDECFRTSHADVWSAGDVARYPDPFFGRQRRVEHWGMADYAGKLAGENMAGGNKKFDLVTYIFSDVFDLHLEFGGDDKDADKKLYRGRPSREGFSLIYLKDGHVNAYFSVNAPKQDYTALSELIQHKVPVADKEKQLADPGFELSKLQEKAAVSTRP